MFTSATYHSWFSNVADKKKLEKKRQKPVAPQWKTVVSVSGQKLRFSSVPATVLSFDNRRRFGYESNRHFRFWHTNKI
jgi:hypothetical protein